MALEEAGDSSHLFAHIEKSEDYQYFSQAKFAKWMAKSDRKG